MNKVSRINKKKELFLLKISDLIDDMIYSGIKKEERDVRLRCNMELDPLLKSNKDDIDFIVRACSMIFNRIDDVN